MTNIVPFLPRRRGPVASPGELATAELQAIAETLAYIRGHLLAIQSGLHARHLELAVNVIAAAHIQQHSAQSSQPAARE